MILGGRRRRRGPVGVREWAESVVASHRERDGGCERCRSVGEAAEWPCLPVRVAQAFTGPPSPGLPP